MAIQQDIDALKRRIAKAQFDCDTWRAAGQQEKHLAAYFLVDALETQLNELQKRPDG